MDKILKNSFLALSFLTLLHCGDTFSDGKKNRIIENPIDPDISIDESSSFTPTGNGTPVTPGENETECVAGENIEVNTNSVSFGTNQVTTEDVSTLSCQTISFGGCHTFSATLDQPSNPNEEPEFYLEVDGSESTTQASGNGSFKVCYKRLKVGTHQATVNLSIDEGASVSQINVSGKTVKEVITLFSPRLNIQESLIVWEGKNNLKKAADDAPYFEYFPYTITGQIDLSEVGSVDTLQLKMSVTNGGSTQIVNIAPDGKFSAVAQIPSSTKIYPVVLSLKTKSGEIKKIIPVVRYGSAAGQITLRNLADGKVINQIEEFDMDNPSQNKSDARQIVGGVKISNIDASAPNADHPIFLKLRIDSASPQNTKKLNLLKNNTSYLNDWTIVKNNSNKISLEYNKGVEFNLHSKTYSSGSGTGFCTVTGFTTNDTFCFDLPPTQYLGQGLNIITASICNEVSEKNKENCQVTSSIVIENGIPTIEITSPLENSSFGLNAPITIKGYIHNMASFKPGVETKNCPAKLWFNSSATDDEAVNAVNLCSFINKTSDGVKFQVIQGGIDKSTSGNSGNLKKVYFEVNVNQNSKLKTKPTLYTNLIQVKATNSKGHTAIKTVSFQRGKQNFLESIDRTANTIDIMTPLLGKISPSTNAILGAPIMAELSEGAINETTIKVLEKVLNDNFKLKELIEGYAPNDQGNIPNLKEDGFDKAIKANAHVNGVARLMEFIKNGQQTFAPEKTNNACGFNTQGTCATIIFPDSLSDERLYGKDVDKEDFWSPVVFGKRNKNFDLIARDGSVIPTKENGWPVHESDIARIAPNLKYNDVYQGPIKINKADLRDDGNIDISITIQGFKGHAFAFTVCNYGSITFPPVMPIIFNAKEIHLNLSLKVKKIQLDKNGKELVTQSEFQQGGKPKPLNKTCQDGNCTLKVIIDPDSIDANIDNKYADIKMLADPECNDTNIGAKFSSKGEINPFGCHLADMFTNEGHPENYYILMETRNDLSYLAQSPGPSLLHMLQQVLMTQLKDTVWCDLPSGMINPLINPKVFPYPDWTPQNVKLLQATEPIEITDDLSLSLKEHDDGAYFEVLNKEDPLLIGTLPISQIDVLVKNEKLQLKLPFKMGTANIASSIFDKKLSYYMSRPSNNADSKYPTDTDPEKMEVSAAINLEEIGNAALSVFLKKGLKTLFEAFDVDDFDMPSGYVSDNWTIGLDQVILSRFEICDDISGLLKAELPKSFLMKGDAFSLFDPDIEALHLDVRIDPNSPPTLAILNEDGEPTIKAKTQATAGSPPTQTLQLGLSNVQLSFTSLYPSKGDGNKFFIGHPEKHQYNPIVTLRIDALLKIKIKYHVEEKTNEPRITIILPKEEETPIYVSVIDAKGIYNHESVVSGVYEVLLKNTFPKIGTETGFIVRLPQNLTEFTNDVETGKASEVGNITGTIVVEDHTKLGSNGECEPGSEPRYATAKTNQNTFTVFDETFIETFTKDYIKAPVDFSDPCQVDPSIEDDSLAQSLCDAGIREISFGAGSPKIEFDPSNGYLNLSTELVIALCRFMDIEEALCYEAAQ